MLFCCEGHCWTCCVHICMLTLGENVIIFVLMYCCTCLRCVIKVILGLHLQQRCGFMAVSEAGGWSPVSCRREAEAALPSGRSPCRSDRGGEASAVPVLSSA